MKRLLLALLFVVVAVVCVYGTATNHIRGNVEPIRAEFKRFYIDSFNIKATETKTITVPGNRWGYNLWIYVSGPATQEESLKSFININTFLGVEHPADSVRKFLICTDLGLDNEQDSLNFYGRFTQFSAFCSTSTAGASVAESVMTFIYGFTAK